ncbi:unnamed protein product [Musa acuminata subsp. malaccensis]|uniref:(wild Malaysian banana) hypothetical protein n=1 Tax=Musa acuminata subsp. malaccensis TaxID=214687 RepID=A0A804K6F3_MUSAM|nr:PREDICTED: uncharacterized protein LOC103994527 [Musa acuminata subsp. malaccensis]CAG1831504.1 unnamed protein product [Musa acuminata subsp. malaccensis]
MELEMTSAKKKPTVSVKKTSAPPPRLLSSLMKPIKVRSFTREEIDRYWRTRRMVEEDHLLFAEKAAARISAKALEGGDHQQFEELLKEMLEEDVKEKTSSENEELRIGIKDWWTKSKYAYLNQPAIRSMGDNAAAERANSTTYLPQKACCYSPPAM